MMLLTNVAFIKHAEGQNQKAYLFSVPDHIILKAGDEVLCDTKKGNCAGICISGSFWVSDVERLAAVVGAYFPLKFVIGRHEVIQKCIPFESDIPF